MIKHKPLLLRLFLLLHFVLDIGTHITLLRATNRRPPVCRTVTTKVVNRCFGFEYSRVDLPQFFRLAVNLGPKIVIFDA